MSISNLSIYSTFPASLFEIKSTKSENDTEWLILIHNLNFDSHISHEISVTQSGTPHLRLGTIKGPAQISIDLSSLGDLFS